MTKLRPLERFIGTWNTTGRLRDGSGLLYATDIYQWLPGKHFILHEVDARLGDRVTRSIEIIGPHARAHSFATRSYDDQGTVEDFTCSLLRRRWRIRGAALRFDGQFSTNQRRLTGTWDMKRGNTWTPWLDIELQRAD